MAKVGRPRRWQSAEKMQIAIDKYFADQDERGKPYTVTGLALALDMDRQRLLDYGSTEQFHDTVKRAKARVLSALEERLLSGQQAAGPIFALKNNHGWKDKQEIEHTGTLTLAQAIAMRDKDKSKT